MRMREERRGEKVDDRDGLNRAGQSGRWQVVDGWLSLVRSFVRSVNRSVVVVVVGVGSGEFRCCYWSALVCILACIGVCIGVFVGMFGVSCNSNDDELGPV